MTVRLTWPTRSDAVVETAGARIVVDPSRKPHARDARGVRDVGRLIAGDNLEALKALIEQGLAGTVDLVYLDPPYMSGVDYALSTTRRSSTATSPPAGKNKNRSHAYGDRWARPSDYLDVMFPRLQLLHRLLAPHGSIWVQVDHRASFLVHALLDEIFGAQRFRNAVVWRRAPPLGRQVQSGQFPRNVDTLVVYAKGDRPRFHPLHVALPIDEAKARYDQERDRWFTLAPRGDYTDASIVRLESEGRVHRTPSGKVYIKYFLERAQDGTLIKPRAVDSMWDDVAPLRHVSLAERTGYPTQKPEKLLERVILSTSDPGDVVLDPFAGSATTAVVAARHGRRFIAIDQSPVAIETARARLDKAAVPYRLERVVAAEPGVVARGHHPSGPRPRRVSP